MRYTIHYPDNRSPLHPHAYPRKKLACEKQGKIAIGQRSENLGKLHLLMNAKLIPAKVVGGDIYKKKAQYMLLSTRLSVSS